MQENVALIDKKGKHVIATLKDNRLVALNEDEKKQGRFVRIDALRLGINKLCAAGSKAMTRKCFWSGAS